VAESREREQIISDPLIIDGQLVALSLSSSADQRGVLRHSTFDVRTGEILRQRELARLRSGHNSHWSCEVAEIENGIVAALSGATIVVDSEGKVRWIRAPRTLEADDLRSGQQTHERLCVIGDRVFIAQPGVRTMDCLAARTGRSHWSVDLPEIVGIIGVTGDLLLVRTDTAIRALSAEDGVTRWNYAAENANAFQVLDNDNLLLACPEPVSGSTDRWQVRLRWLNLEDGELVGASVLPDLEDAEPCLGPLVPYQDRIFTFFGRGQYDAARDVIELVPND
jgi:hypothetical protein